MANTADNIINQLYAKSAPEVEDDPDFSEVEARINTAQYYKLLLSNSLFDDDDSFAAQQVEAEIRDFVKTRIKILVGLEATKINVVERDPSFTAEEIQALKILAHKLLEGSAVEKPATKTTTETVETPVVAPEPKRTVKAAPTVKRGRKPSLRRTAVPDDLKESQETVVTPKVRPTTPSPKNGKASPGEEGSQEHVVLEPNPKNGAPRIRKNGKILEQSINPEDGSIHINEHGGEIWLDVTPQAKPPPGAGFIPMPSPYAMEQKVMQEQANAEQRISGGHLETLIGAVLKG